MPLPKDVQCRTRERKDETKYTICYKVKNNAPKPEKGKKFKVKISSLTMKTLEDLLKSPDRMKKMNITAEQVRNEIEKRQQAQVADFFGDMQQKGEKVAKQVEKTKDIPPETGVNFNDKKQTEELAKIMTEYYYGEPVLYVCQRELEAYYYYKILDRNKNNCAIPFLSEGDIIDNKYKLIGASYRVGYDTNEIEMYMDAIVDRYKECKSKGKMLAIPFNPNPVHANMLVFNYHRKKLEWYEPHGAEYKGTQGRVQGNTEFVLNELAEKCGLELEKSEASCPRVPANLKKKALEKVEEIEERITAENRKLLGGRSQKKVNQLKRFARRKLDEVDELVGLQHFDGTPEQNLQKTKMAGMMIKDPGGFCCMWSYLYLDYRLKFPKLPPNRLGELLFEKFKEDIYTGIRNFIRGFTKEIMDNLFESVNPKDVKKLTQKSTTSLEADRIYNESRKRARTAVLNAIIKFKY